MFHHYPATSSTLVSIHSTWPHYMLARTTIGLLFILSVFSVAFGQNTDIAADKRRNDYDVRLSGIDKAAAASRIDTTKPIGEFDAYALAWAYFLSHISTCGFPELPKDSGDRWVAQTRVGIAGQPGPAIIIEKAGGTTYSEGKPKVRPKDFRK